MTSSLVGSEMCIRDRKSCGNYGKSSLRSRMEEMVCKRRSPGTTSIQEPVSYTHLTLPTICSV
eukprot:9110286-Prorocentrum_lima.AAC.1